DCWVRDARRRESEAGHGGRQSTRAVGGGHGDHSRARHVAMKAFACLLVAMAIGSIAFAQTSASYKLTEFALNSGGDPSNATSAGSASFRIRLDAIGDAVVATGLSSASHRMDGGFV